MPSTLCPDDIDLDRPPRGYLRRRKRTCSHQFGWTVTACGYDVDILVRAEYTVLPGWPATEIDPPEFPMIEDGTFEVSLDEGRTWCRAGSMLTEALAEDERVRELLLDAARRE